jgi:predicted aminopeptidase
VSIRKKIFISILTVLLILVIWQWELISYGFAQGKGQLHIIRNSVPIEDVLADPTFPDSLKQRIAVIQQARRFAINRLGLTPSNSYSTFYDQKGTVALWNVTACEAYSLTPKTWWFPIVGVVPYKGFFDESKAQSLGKDLEKQGLDVRIRPVGGWSTLGWFDDPMLSSMLDRSTGALAELIIHELTHGTVFVKDSVTFNENLASFIGEKGAEIFLRETFGDSSSILIEYMEGETDAKKFSDHILSATNKLDSLYKSFDQEMPKERKEIKKRIMIDLICEQLDTVSFANDRYRSIFKNSRPNNAFFMSFVTYYSFGEKLEEEYRGTFNSDLIAFIAYTQRKYSNY